MNFDDLIDQFVQRVNESPHEPIWYDEVPESIRKGFVDKNESFWDWNIKPHDASSWIEELEAKLPVPFSKAFRSFVTRYIFPRFVIGDIHFWANTPEGIRDTVELRTGIFADKYMSSFLLERGFIQFARPEANYDAICFDTNSHKNGEFRIVRIEHENILIHDRIVITEILAPSFHEMIADYLTGSAKLDHS